MGESGTWLAAFGAGALSFISPCVLPFIPCYLRIVSGHALGDTGGAGPAAPRHHVIRATLAFALGILIALLGLGVAIAATALGAPAEGPGAMTGRVAIAGRAAGLIVVGFGIYLLGGLRLPGRARESASAPRRPAGPVGAGLAGGAFALGWTPCFGPVLAGVIALAGPLDSVGRAAGLLAAFALGLAAPFVLAPSAAARVLSSLGALGRHARHVEMASAVLLIAIGMLLVADRLVAVMGVLAL